MEKEYFLSAGIPPPGMHAWTSELPDSEQAPPCYLNSNWDKQNDHFGQMDSGFGSMASSSHSPDSGVPPDAFVLRELIRKMGPLQHFPAGSVAHANTSGNFTSYAPPLSSSSPQTQLHAPMMRNPVPVNPGLPSLTADPGFAERAAKFSCFGSRSFNGRTTQFVSDNPYRSGAAPATENGKLPRVSSSPVLKQGGIPAENGNSGQPQMELSPAGGVFPVRASSNEESSISEQVLSGGETGQLNSRKRKAASRGKAKEDANKGTENDADKNAKRPKESEAAAMEVAASKTKADEEAKTNEDAANQKPLPEPPKDYIHVRARRGQATDSHSLAERVRREKISERMKLLQDLVPGCNKVTGKALMLDEIINYVQSLQRQVEFLSMKLASVNPRLDSMDNLLPKDGFQPNAALFPMETSDPALYKNQNQNQHHQNQQLQNHISMEQGNNPGLSRNMGMQLASLDGFIENLPQFASFSEDDLHSIVQMGYGQDGSFHTQTFQGSNQSSHMKIEI